MTKKYYHLKYVVSDIDNTIGNDSHRSRHAVLEDYDTYHRLLQFDPIHEDAVFLLRALKVRAHSPIGIILCTARPEKYREATIHWLTCNNIPWDVLLMRPEGDTRRSAHVKIAQLVQYFSEPDDPFETGLAKAQQAVAFFLEDHKPVIDSLRENGFCAWQVRERKD